METPSNTARQPARERFATSEQYIDLNDAVRRLLDEPHAGQHGHRQIALHKTSHTTIALFAFEAGGRIPEHRAHGTVIIQALAGRLNVSAVEATHVLVQGQVLVLAPDVPHAVSAEEASQMLLTVSLVPSSV